ncbi:MAG: hypothetical protein AUI14_02720 [Actinobacteria bacterium 13_2_20CM_2_71_6]|nr:MAG: hypothetical protein AUI14_02720 [Actinobacteria bacterium 13_2_20CM_2_71_6]
MPLIRRGALADSEPAVPPGFVLGRSVPTPGNGRPEAAAATRDGGPETARAGGPEVMRGTASGRAMGTPRWGIIGGGCAGAEVGSGACQGWTGAPGTRAVAT